MRAQAGELRFPGGKGSMRAAQQKHRGVTAVLAMLYLVLFATLALGFYAAVTTQVEIAGNDVRGMRAQLAAESGTDFMRYQLGKVALPSGTTQGQILTTVASQLATLLNGTSNMGSMTVGSVINGTVQVPSVTSQFIPIDSTGAGVHAEISQSGDLVNVKVTARDATGKSMRAILLSYQMEQGPHDVLGYGVVTKGSLTLGGGAIKGVPDATRGTFFSTASVTNPLKMSGSANIGNKVYFTNPSGAISGSGGTIGGISYPAWTQNVTTGVTAPAFPTIDTTAYANYMAVANPPMTLITGNYGASSGPLSNIRIKAGTNPQFSGGCTISGLIYIEMPNQVTFSGGPNITGVIVVDKPNDTSANSILISGNGTLTGPENLPASYGTLCSMTGAAILAPNCDVSFTGGSCSLGGSLFVKSTLFSGGGNGAVNGSILSYGTAASTWSGGSGVTFTNTGPVPVPTTGVTFAGGHFTPVMSSYADVDP